MREISIKEAKSIMLNMANFIHKICIENDIKYSLAYGTLIGAVRHNGFIPWDDDFDIFMTRENYEKLIKILKKSNDYYVLDFYEDDYIFNFAKLCSKRFIGKLTSDDLRPHPKSFGIFIDIFPLDNIVDSPDNWMKTQKKLVHALSFTSFYTFNKAGKKSRTFIKSFTNFPKLLFYKFIITKNRILSKIETLINEAKKNKDINLIGIYSSGSKEVYSETDFKEYVLHKFENYELMIIKNYDPVLRLYYGNYMNPPEESKRKGHHPYTYFDTK